MRAANNAKKRAQEAREAKHRRPKEDEGQAGHAGGAGFGDLAVHHIAKNVKVGNIVTQQQTVKGSLMRMGSQQIKKVQRPKLPGSDTYGDARAINTRSQTPSPTFSPLY